MQEAKDIYNDNIRDTHWLGEVMDNEDPLLQGRCKIKVFGKFDNISTLLYMILHII